MAIRLRKVDGYYVALCVVEADAKVGDIYLDDGMHGALMTKCAEDFNRMFGDSMCQTLPVDEKVSGLMRTQEVRDAKEEFLKWDKQRQSDLEKTRLGGGA